MKSFLLYEGKKPTLKWNQIPDEYYFEGEIPQGFSLAICPNFPYIVLDVDRHGDMDGFLNIPLNLIGELENHFHYSTKNNGKHYWLKYTGEEHLMNKTSGMGIDLRTNKGYVRWYLKGDIRDCLHEIKETSPSLNLWLENLFK